MSLAIKALSAGLGLAAFFVQVAGCEPPPTEFPNDATTGPSYAGLDEDNLPSCDAPSDWTISTPGTTIEGCEFIGTTIRVTAANVTLRNMVILGNNTFIVWAPANGNLTVENSVVGPRPGANPIAPQGHPCGAALGYGDFRLIRSEVFGCADGLKAARITTVRDSYIHGLHRSCNPSDPSDCTHNDTVQFPETQSLSALTFTGNTAIGRACTSNRHFQLKNMRDATVHIDGNFFYGFHGVANADGTAGGNSGTISGNTLAGTSTEGPFSSKADGSSMSPGLYTGAGLAGITRSGNVFEDGNPEPATGVAKPYQCTP